jgi:hypothetical protein
MRTTSSARSTAMGVAAGIAVATVVALLVTVGPTASAMQAAEFARALTARYGTTWIAAAGVVALAASLVRRSRPARPAPAPAPAPTKAPARRADGRPRLTLVPAEVRS